MPPYVVSLLALKTRIAMLSPQASHTVPVKFSSSVKFWYRSPYIGLVSTSLTWPIHSLCCAESSNLLCHRPRTILRTDIDIACIASWLEADFKEPSLTVEDSWIAAMYGLAGAATSMITVKRAQAFVAYVLPFSTILAFSSDSHSLPPSFGISEGAKDICITRL